MSAIERRARRAQRAEAVTPSDAANDLATRRVTLTLEELATIVSAAVGSGIVGGREKEPLTIAQMMRVFGERATRSAAKGTPLDKLVASFRIDNRCQGSWLAYVDELTANRREEP